MRLIDLNDNWQNKVFCFEIILVNGQIINLTSNDSIIKNGEVIFYPYSGLKINHAKFNESGQDRIILSGIFEINGIENHYNLESAKLTIYFSQDNQLQNLFTFNCINFIRNALKFEIILESNINKYNQSILLQYSKTCRANFGDEKCKIDLELYSFEYIIDEINGREISIVGLDKENGFFNNGTAIIDKIMFNSKIISQINGKIELYKSPPQNLKQGDKIKLVSGCDKSFTTCCIKFNNAVNFRGEPNIPEANFIKVY